jgi:hypothetical protein
MHPNTLSQLVADRKDELAADAQRQRNRRRALPAADESMTRREWRTLLRVLLQTR